MSEFEVSAGLWRWEITTKNGSWFFITIRGDVADQIRAAAMAGPWMVKRRGFGSVKVQAELGATHWTTSLFPHEGGESWLLPVKAAVRRAEQVEEGDVICVTIRVLEA